MWDFGVPPKNRAAAQQRYNIFVACPPTGIAAMSCKHLKELYATCRRHHLKLSSSDLIRLICPICGVEEECPDLLYEEYELRHADDREDSAAENSPKSQNGLTNP